MSRRASLAIMVLAVVLAVVAGALVSEEVHARSVRSVVPVTSVAPGLEESVPPPPAWQEVTPSTRIAEVGEESVTVTEPGRVTCVPGGGGCSTRSYLLHVYYPALGSAAQPVVSATPFPAATPFPLIVFGAGFDLDPSSYLPLIEGWVRGGYVVAAPRFPLSSAWALQHYNVNLGDRVLADEFESDLLNQPGDMRAAIQEVAALDAAANNPLQGLVNTADVGVAGQSDGGDTSLAFAYNSCCRDPAVKAAAILSGAEFSPFGGEFFGAPAVPLLVTQGTADTVNPPSASTQIFDAAPSPKYLVLLEGADHLAPYTAVDPWEKVVLKSSLAFFASYLKGQPTSGTGVATVGNVAGVASEQADP